MAAISVKRPIVKQNATAAHLREPEIAAENKGGIPLSKQRRNGL
ncbi:hypothetical protein ACJ2_27940 [Pantoea sp. QMID2]|nr:hypothetical protein ACJ1_27220 [Pantoea sp. QMID1]GME42910.1 hypothetical protein ACJ3_31540 [Pantoea sp. QMID3]GME56691.1 hypothetical protein ACJ4_23720 [Pantoea sp. QMID4]GME59178.1 hypothetical protein ACJ2_27940 [Pantoea sp. QMID2]